MKSYGQYCPIAKAVEVLGERWSLLVMRELLIGSTHFNDIARGLPGISRSLLSKRLRQLTAAGMVERVDGAYALTPAGAELQQFVFGLGDWAARWILNDPEPDELDPDLLMWWGHIRLDTASLPDRRVVLEFRFRDERRRYWIVVEDVGCSVCLHDPGFGVDAVVTTDLLTLHQLWHGRDSWTVAQREDRVSFWGTPAIVRRLPEVLTLRTLADLATTDDPPGAPRLVP